jgi:Zn-dependent protease
VSWQPPIGPPSPPPTFPRPPSETPAPGSGWGRPAPRRSSGPSTALIVLLVLAILAVIGLRTHRITGTAVIVFCVIVPSIILHEVSHGVVAYWLGDDTAKRAGRLSLNPLRHVDPLGTVVLPILLVLTTGVAFGWARPVPVRVDRLRHPRNDAVLVALAGPVTNLLVATVAGIGFHLLVGIWPLPSGVTGQWELGEQILFYLGFVNVLLATFNLLPIPPLDGSALLERLLPARLLPGYYRVRMAFLFLVLFVVLVLPGAISPVLDWAINHYFQLIA